MARVVQQRGSPPYLTIVFVLLFLVATTMAVLFYLSADKAQTANTENEQLLDRLVSRAQRNEGRIQQLMRKAAQQRDVTVVGELTDQLDELTTAITGKTTPADQTLEEVRTLMESVEGAEGLAAALRSAIDQRDQARQNVQDLNDELASCTQQLKEKEDQLAQLIMKQKEQRRDDRQQLVDLQNQLEQREEAHEKQLEEARQKWQETRAQLDATIAEKTQQVEQLRRRTQALDLQLTEAKRRLQEQEGSGEAALPQPDGQVVNVMREQEFCYINIGKDSNVRAGNTFAVYPSTGIPEDGSSKGRIVVVNPKENVSACRIVEEDPRDPILEGDLVGNVAFDPTRTYRFAVEGYFDLHGTGRASATGAEEIKTLIRRYGGEVTDELDVQTDFLVLGYKPYISEPGRNASPQEIAAYNARKSTLQSYERAKARALELNIPILSTNKFLSLIGYSPALSASR